MGPIAAVVMVAVVAAQAGANNPDLQEAQKALQEGRIPRALYALDKAEKALTVTEDDLVQIHLLRATCLMATGKKPQADASFDALLKLRPHSQAALEGLAKMRWVHQLGVPQAVLPPQPRPSIALLRRLGVFVLCDDASP